MKDKNLPNNYETLSLEELTNLANKMVNELESQKEFREFYRKISRSLET